MHYKTRGEGENLLVFLHPFPTNLRFFSKMLENFEIPNNWRVILPDLPGFGKSPSHTEDILSMDTLAKRVYTLISNEEYEKLVLGGVSMGGYTVMALEKLHPDLAHALILSNTSDQADADGGKNREVIAQRVMHNGKEEFLDGLLIRLLGKTSFKVRPKLIAEVKEIIYETSNETIAQAMRGMGKRQASREILSQVDKPILVICGSEDEITGSALASEMVQNYRNAKLEILEEVGHFSAMEKPKEYAALILNFIESL